MALIDMTALCDLLELEVKRHKTSKRKIPGMAALTREGRLVPVHLTNTHKEIKTVDGWYVFLADNILTICSVCSLSVV